jgi:hypothetical protein
MATTARRRSDTAVRLDKILPVLICVVVVPRSSRSSRRIRHRPALDDRRRSPRWVIRTGPNAGVALATDLARRRDVGLGQVDGGRAPPRHALHHLRHIGVLQCFAGLCEPAIDLNFLFQIEIRVSVAIATSILLAGKETNLWVSRSKSIRGIANWAEITRWAAVSVARAYPVCGNRPENKSSDPGEMVLPQRSPLAR